MAGAVVAQDTRNVVEPKIPGTCTTLTANLPAVLSEADEAKLDTTRIQQAMDGCEKGKAVVLKAAQGNSAFLTGPLQLRAGVTLVVDGGAVLYGSRNPRDYDVAPGTCGVVNEKGRGCKAMLNGSGVADAGVMGGGVIDGRGGSKLLGQNVTWWDLAQEAKVKNLNQSCPRI